MQQLAVVIGELGTGVYEDALQTMKLNIFEPHNNHGDLVVGTTKRTWRKLAKIQIKLDIATWFAKASQPLPCLGARLEDIHSYPRVGQMPNLHLGVRTCLSAWEMWWLSSLHDHQSILRFWWGGAEKVGQEACSLTIRVPPLLTVDAAGPACWCLAVAVADVCASMTSINAPVDMSPMKPTLTDCMSNDLWRSAAKCPPPIVSTNASGVSIATFLLGHLISDFVAVPFLFSFCWCWSLQLVCMVLLSCSPRTTTMHSDLKTCVQQKQDCFKPSNLPPTRRHLCCSQTRQLPNLGIVESCLACSPWRCMLWHCGWDRPPFSFSGLRAVETWF